MAAARPVKRAMRAAAALAGGCTSWQEYVHNGFKVGPNYRKPPHLAAWHDHLDKLVRSNGSMALAPAAQARPLASSAGQGYIAALCCRSPG
jgi:hypothetical protein